MLLSILLRFCGLIVSVRLVGMVMCVVSGWLVWICFSIVMRLVIVGSNGVWLWLCFVGVVVCVWLRWWWMWLLICVMVWCSVLLGLCVFLFSFSDSVVSGVFMLCVRFEMWCCVVVSFVLFWLISVFSLVMIFVSFLGWLVGMCCCFLVWIFVSDSCNLMSGCSLICSWSSVVSVNFVLRIVIDLSSGISVLWSGVVIMWCGFEVEMMIGLFVVLSVIWCRWSWFLCGFLILVGWMWFWLWCCLWGLFVFLIGVFGLFF